MSAPLTRAEEIRLTKGHKKNVAVLAALRDDQLEDMIAGWERSCHEITDKVEWILLRQRIKLGKKRLLDSALANFRGEVRS